jgi:hypothetical protein
VAVLEARLSPQQNDSLKTWVTAELGGRERWVDTAVLAELIRQDEKGFPTDAELVLAVPEAGGRNAVLVRLLANSLGRSVWSPTHGLELTDDGAPPRLALASTDPDQEPWGDWLKTSPGPERLSEKYYQAGMNLTDPKTGKSEWVPDSALWTHTMVTGTGHKSTGRASFTPKEWAIREEHYPIARHAEYYVMDPREQLAVLVAARPAPWAEAVAAGMPVYEFAAHANRFGHVYWHVMDGRRMRSTAVGAGNYLRRRWSVRALDQQAPPGHKTLILLMVCEQQPLSAVHDDPLEWPGPGQLFSTGSGHRVIASPSKVGTVHVPWQISSGNLPAIEAGFDGSLPQLHILAPEPNNDELAALAPAFGFAPGPDPYPRQTLMEAIRLLRALRIAVPLTAWDAPTPEEDPELAGGIGVLEALRRDDPVLRDFGPFTLDFLDHATDAYARRHGRTSDDRRELCRDLLRWAHRRRNDPSALEPAAPASLTTLLDMTEITSTAAWWATHGGDALVQGMLRPKDGTPADGQKPAKVTETDRGQAFWLLVRAGNALTRAAEAATAAGRILDHGAQADRMELVARQVLHLAKKTPVDQKVHDLLRFRVAQALAHGYPATASAAWAAWDLEVMGVLDTAEEMLTGAESIGWSLMGSRVQDLFTGGVATETSRLPTLPEPWSSSFTVWEVGHIRQATVEVAVSGGYLMMPSHDALAHLIYRTLDRERDARGEIVLIGTAENEQAALRLARTIADITGRMTHVEPGGSELRANASGHLICARPGDRAATSAHWWAARPHRPHFKTVEISRPLTRAHPIGPDQDGRAFDLRSLNDLDDLTVRVEFVSGPAPVSEEDREAVWQRAVDGVRDMFNVPVRIIYKSRLHVTLERVGPGGDAHLTVELTGPQGSPRMSRTLWRTDATPRELAVLIADQLGFDNTGAWPPDLEDIPRGDAVNYRQLIPPA